MRYYNTLNKDIEFIVLQHTIKGTNTEILGIRYRDGYAVVAKGSKEHKRLKSMPRAASKEYPITFLQHLKFVINPKQISVIWGRAVYQYYMIKLEEKLHGLETVADRVEKPLCAGTTKDGFGCKSEKLACSDYCRTHLFYDKRLADDFANRKKLMDKDEKRLFVDGLILKLEELK